MDEIQSTNSISGSIDRDRSEVPVVAASKSKDETDHNDPMNNNQSSWMTTTTAVNGKSVDVEEETHDFGAGMGHRLRHIDSGEIGWWENDDDDDDDDKNDDTLADDLTMNLIEENDKVDLRQVQLTPPPEKVVYRIKRIESGEKAWWMDDSPSKEPSPVVKTRSSPSAPVANVKLSHVQSGERTWWLSDANDESEKPTDQTDQSLNKTEKLPPRTNTSHNRGESSERAAWWLSSDSDSGKATSEATNNVMNKSYTISRENENDDRDEQQRIKQRYGVTEKSGSASNSNENSAETNGYRNRFNAIRHVDSGEKAWWMQDESDVVAGTTTSNTHSASDSTTTTSAAQSIAAIARDIGAIASSNTAFAVERKPPQQRHSVVSVDYDELGDRASPEGLEDTSTTVNGRQSPYDNVNAKSTAKKLFISRHTNIDDLLGGSCHPLSPLLMDRFSASPPRCDAGKSTNGSDVYQEISAAQVRIHDSTAQMPEIRRMHADG